MLDYSVSLLSPDHTDIVADCLAAHLKSGDTVLLSGGVGAGKTHLARRIIQTHLAKFDMVEDVPSPTFTLVQTYETPTLTIWHADLYRLTHVDELYELGLEAAFGTDVCLIEWPDLLGDLSPIDALNVGLAVTGDHTRQLSLEWQNTKWNNAVAAIQTQLAKA